MRDAIVVKLGSLSPLPNHKGVATHQASIRLSPMKHTTLRRLPYFNLSNLSTPSQRSMLKDASTLPTSSRIFGER